MTTKPNRNDPCPCGSGRKYKQCCLQAESTTAAAQADLNRRRQNLPALLKTAAALLAARKPEEAAAAFRQVLEIEPKNLEATLGLGKALYNGKDHEAALAQYHKALRLQPSALVYSEIGNILMDARRYAEAETHYREAIRLYPKMPGTYNNLALVLDMQARFAEEEVCLERAISLQPELLLAHNNLLFCLSHSPDFNLNKYLNAARRFGALVSARAKPFHDWPADTAGAEPLVVGIVSGDLRTHPVGYFLEGVLAELAPSRIRINAYYHHRTEDDLSAELKQHCANWTDICDLDDETAARRIREDGVQILIDLAGHSSPNRLGLFAWKPAPVAVTWLGYFASTGVPAIDYIFTDPVAAPAGSEGQFTETPYPLPDTRLCFRPPRQARDVAVSPLPARVNGNITFGCFQNPRKINPEVLALWGAVLKAVPGSRLLIKHSDFAFEGARASLMQRMAASGIDTDRIIPEAHADYRDYLDAYSRVDVVLDTFPFPGGTTTCEALWMGVPTLTLSGNSMLSKQGESLLTAAGLPDWIAADKDDYIRKAATVATRIDELAALRQGLRDRLRASPLMDASRFARHLEDALLDIWARRKAI